MEYLEKHKMLQKYMKMHKINEKIEIDKVSNYIEELFEWRERKNPVITSVKEAIEKGTVYKENTSNI